MSRPAVFFDRDGVLNEDTGYVFEISQFKWISGACEAIKLANEADYYAFVVTNQSGVARGMYDEASVQSLHQWMSDDLAKAGAHIDAFEYCPYHPEAVIEKYRCNSRRRKPEPGMIEDLLQRFPVDKERSFLVGDRSTDLDAARSAGIHGHLFSGGDLAEFLGSVLRLNNGQ